MSYALADKYTREDGTIFLTGAQALVRVVLEQHRVDERDGRRTAGLVSGYQGSPLATLDLEIQRQRKLLDAHDIVHQAAVNEELAATALMGSQTAAVAGALRFAGVYGLWYGKAPGLDRAGDAIKHANLIGSSPTGGVIVAVGDDAACKSSTLPSASETALYDALLPVLSPADAQEVIDLGLHGYALSRVSGLWVGMKIATAVADGFGTVAVGGERVRPELPSIEVDGRPFVHQPSSRLSGPVALGLERSLHGPRLELARRYGTLNGLNRVTQATAEDRIGIVAAGKTYVDVRQALRRIGLDDEALARNGVRLLKVGMPFPLDREVVRSFARGLRDVVIVEEKRPFLEMLVKEALYGMADAPAVVGKRDAAGEPLVPATGELDVDAVTRAIATALRPHVEVQEPRATLAVLPAGAAEASIPQRTPYFCSGCPHNRSTKTPEGSVVGGGIGCHGMALLMPPSEVGDVTGLTPMGGEGAQWIGIAPFVDTSHFIQNLGDGTFVHSGSLAIRAAVAANAHMTFKLLYNSAVAMTGGQQAMGALPIPQLTRLLEAEGVARVIVTTDTPGRYRGVELAPNAAVWHRDRLLDAQRELAAVGGVTVLVHEQECAAELRRKRKRGKAPTRSTRVVINERVCEGCGDCGRASNCLSVLPVETEFGRKTRIDQTSCNTDYSCLDGDCPAFVTVEVAGPPARRASGGAAELAADALPEPERRFAADGFSMRITGVGGTGVVTVAQVLGTAAMLDGLFVRGLDQTGLAQKGGPVVSDLVLAARPGDVASKVAGGGADLYLGADLLVAGDAVHAAALDRDRSLAIVSTTEVPTGAMVADPAVAFPELEGVLARIERRANEVVAMDAARIANELFGVSQAANMLLLGAAFQAGGLPVSAEAIEQAIELNGTAVAANQQAFRRGRQAIADPEALDRARRPISEAPVAAPEPAPAVLELASVVGCDADGELAQLVRRRVAELVAYQDASYARSYATFVEQVRAAEARIDPASDALARAVAFHLHKLMAYKDEYEVARLHLDPELRARIERELGTTTGLKWHLHPPALRALGMKRKLRFGAWFAGAYRVLYGARRLRGTPLDPFGRAEVRRVERALVGEYRAAIERALEGLTADRLGAAVELASLPDAVRGYEEIKLANVERYRERMAQALEGLGALPPAVDAGASPAGAGLKA